MNPWATSRRLLAMGRPSYDDETLAAYFYPMHPSLFEHPVCGEELQRLAARDADIVAAVADEDRTLVRDSMRRPPEKHFLSAVSGFNSLAMLRPVKGGHQESDRILAGLQRANVDFLVAGIGAALLLNVPILTDELAIVHRRTPENVGRLLEWLSVHGARGRDDAADRGLPPKEEALLGHGHLELRTDLGKVDVLCEVEEGVGYEALLPDTLVVESGAGPLRVLGLPRSIALLARTGGIKDRAVLPILIATLDEQCRKKG